MLGPFLRGWQQRDTWQGIVGMVVTVVFAVTYAWIWVDRRRSRARFVVLPPLRKGLLYIGILLALAIGIVICVGGAGTTAFVFVSVAAVMMLPLVVVAPMVVIEVLMLLAGHVFGWQDQGGTAFGVLVGPLAILGARTIIARNIELWRAHEENTRLAVESERNRFARDLHDILGHSLTVITVKAELAQRLMDSDAPGAEQRARTEIADLERLSRDALADVRRAVAGYRELTLPGELARARAALTSAEIEAVVPQSTDSVPSDLRELFAWTVREGVTNVIRHSGAQRCEIVLTPTSAAVRDDGGGPVLHDSDGNGLRGLRERASAAGAVVVTRTLDPGFALEVGVVS
jgi:two-component system sensor histidine kinase DesK